MTHLKTTATILKVKDIHNVKVPQLVPIYYESDEIPIGWAELAVIGNKIQGTLSIRIDKQNRDQLFKCYPSPRQVWETSKRFGINGVVLRKEQESKAVESLEEQHIDRYRETR